MTEADVYRIGRIGKPHGVTGEMTFVFTDDIFDRSDTDYLLLRVDGLLVPFFIEQYRFRSDTTALLSLEGVDSFDRARELTNCDVFFPRAQATGDEGPTPASIVGYTIVGDDGKVVGEVTSVDDTTANTLLVVDDGRLLIPVADEYVKDIDTARRRITMTLPDGLLEL